MIGEIGGNMNNKGQALIEFVLILPIFIFILFAVIDFGRIFSIKNSLENNSTDIVDLYKDGKSISEIEDIYTNNKIEIFDTSGHYKFKISRSIKLITPGFNRLFGYPYLIVVERVVPSV